MKPLVLRAVGKIYGGRRALHAVSARFEPGRVAAVLGPNGAGKTTHAGDPVDAGVAVERRGSLG